MNRGVNRGDFGESNGASLWISLLLVNSCLICACFVGDWIKVYGSVI